LSERNNFNKSQAITATASRLAAQEARNKSLEPEEIGLLLEGQSSPVLLEGKADADEMRNQANSALSAKKISMFARNENFANEYFA